MFIKYLINGLLALVFGMFLGLIYRIWKEHIEVKDYIRSILISIRFLIVYPFMLFPFLFYICKDEIAELVASRYLKTHRCNKPKRKIKNIIKRNFTFKFIIIVWFEFLKEVSRDYNKYVNVYMELTKDVIEAQNAEKIMKKQFKQEAQKYCVNEQYRTGRILAGAC